MVKEIWTQLLYKAKNADLRNFFKFKGDAQVWFFIISLYAISILTVYSSTFSLAYKSGDINALNFLYKHVGMILLGFAITFITHNIHYSVFRGLSNIFIGAAFIFLCYTLFKGQVLNSASRWITVGGIRFQPSEFAKIALLMYIAKELHYMGDEIREWFGLKRILWAVAIICGLIVSENLSTAILLAVVCFILLFFARAKIKHLAILCITGITIAVIAGWGLIEYKPQGGRMGTWRNRIERFVGISEPSADKALQVTQSKIAIATGGISGKGPGESTQKYFLPHAYSDYIFTIICEEYGIYGPLLILFLYFMLIYRLGNLIIMANVQYPAYLAAGIIFMLVFQATVHILVACDLMPVTGQTLPLVSWGGTSILINSFGMGLVQSVFTSIKKQKKLKDQALRQQEEYAEQD